MLIQSSSEAPSSPRLIDPALLSTTPDLVLPHSAVTFDRNVSAADWSAGTSAGQKRPRLTQAEEFAVSVYASAQFALTWSPSDVDFSDLVDKNVTKSHCFAMGEQSRDYFGRPIVYSSLQARLAVPPTGRDHLPLEKITDDTVRRPIGKAFHLIITSLPRMADASALETGFALLTMCKLVGSTWRAKSFVSFEKSAQRCDLELTGNLDRCTGEAAGRRIWGQRTSHVAHDPWEPAKPFRIQSRGLTKAVSEQDDYCILLSLHGPDGWMLSDATGRACIARSNTFAFGDPSQSATQAAEVLKLAEALEKLPIQERVTVSPSTAISPHISLETFKSIQHLTGVVVNPSTLPDTACPLSDFTGQGDDWFLRIASTCFEMGQRHANEALRDPIQSSRFPNSFSYDGALGRYGEILLEGMDAAKTWLTEHGVKLTVKAVRDRAEHVKSKMGDRRYRSRWHLCVGNVYPQGVLVDRLDPSRCYGLSEEGRETQLMLMDRMYPLARFAFTTKLTQAQFQEWLFEPYQRGLSASRDASVDGDWQWQKDKERFDLHLHAIHLDYFLYWVNFRNAESVKRIEARLIEEDSEVLPDVFAPFRKLVEDSSSSS